MASASQPGTGAKPKRKKTRRRKLEPGDNPVTIQRCLVKHRTWKLIELLAGDWGMGFGIDCLADKLLQREAEVIMLTSMLQANLPKAKPDAMVAAHSLGSSAEL